jgi:RecB family exonuclease
VAPRFVEAEVQRRRHAIPEAFENEAKGTLIWPDLGFTLIGRADRIDRRQEDDAVLIYDYKTGTPPNANEQKHFDKQLLIEAAMVEQGAFDRLGMREVAGAVFIGLGGGYVEVEAPLADEPPEQILRELRELILAYLDPARGFTARRAMRKDGFGSDYDLLSRFGEWDITQDPVPEDLA